MSRPLALSLGVAWAEFGRPEAAGGISLSEVDHAQLDRPDQYLGPRLQAHLVPDVGQVLLDRSLRHEHASADLLIGQPLGQPLEQFLLAGSQSGVRHLRAGGFWRVHHVGDEFLAHGRRQWHVPVDGLVDGREERGPAGILEQLAGRAGAQSGNDVLAGAEGGQRHDAGAGPLTADVSGGVDA